MFNRVSLLLAVLIAAVCLVGVTGTFYVESGSVCLDVDDATATLISGGDRIENARCVASSSNYWCQMGAEQEPCDATACTTCTTCFADSAFVIRRCLPGGDGCNHFAGIARDCGAKMNGVCNFPCVGGSWEDCLSNGASSGSCGTLVITSCTP